VRSAGDLSGAVQILRTRPDTGDEPATRRLAHLLAKRSDIDEALQVLRAAADASEGYAAFQLAKLLGEHGDLDGRITGRDP
jgi:TPR repeat protein